MANQKQIKLERPHFKNLDALRFLAAFSVFIFHFINEVKALVPISEDNVLFKTLNFVTSKGMLGVNFFFVLSGFLITFLILFEIKQNDSFNLKNFLIRRTLRIWPLYFIIIIVGFVLFPLFFDSYQTEHNPINYILFLANFDEIWNGANDSINFLTSPWSVAVEEQFYLVWGLLLYILNRLKILQLNTVLILLLIVALIFRYLNIDNERLIYFHTISVMPDILTGALLANLYFNNNIWINKIQNLKRWKIILVYCFGILLILFKTKIFTNELIAIERFVFAIFFAFIVLDQITFKNSFFKFGKIKLFNHLGKISYGLYMYHLVILFLLHKLMVFMIYKLNGGYYIVTIIYFILGMSGTYLISLVSHKFIEKPFLKFKNKFV